MRSDDCIQAAKSNLADAHRLLDSGEAVNWISGHLGSALHWAMAGWLLAHGHTASHGRGWSDTREAFLELGPDELRSQLITLYPPGVARAGHAGFSALLSVCGSAGEHGAPKH